MSRGSPPDSWAAARVPSKRLDALVWPLLRLGGASASGILLLVLFFLGRESWPALRSVGTTRWFTDDGWHPSASAAAGQFGLAPMIAGTLLSSAGAVLLAGMLGVGTAVFCRFYAPRVLGALLSRSIELLAGIPSVVFGLWGLTTLAPLVRRIEPPGPSLCTGILVLAFMILPTVALLAEAALRAVPRGYAQAAAALALSRRGTVWRVFLPAAAPGLRIAVLLASARAVGETMAIVMVCGNVVQLPKSLFDPVRTLTANVALELGYAAGDHRSALFVSGLVLMLAIIGLVGLAHRVGRSPVRA